MSTTGNTAGTCYVEYVPRPPLSTSVAYLWALSDAPAQTRERIVASGTQELVINLYEDAFTIFDETAPLESRRFSGAIVSGAYRRCFLIDTRAHTSIIGVHFRPGGAFPFLGTAPGELADHHVDLDALWGGGAHSLRERLVRARGSLDQFRILEDALSARLRRAPNRHPAVHVAVERLSGDAGTVTEISSQVGLSRRRLIEVFTREVGMTPKLFGRVQRFQRAFATIRKQARFDWATIALDCGYFDQSHMIRDFVEFAGVTPGEAARRVGPPVKEHHLAEPGW